MEEDTRQYTAWFAGRGRADYHEGAMTSHSHAAEAVSTKPTFADLQQDWNPVKAAQAVYPAN